MAFIAQPGVAQVRVTGKIGPNPWAVVLHWYSGAPAAWTQSQVQALATSVRSHWDTSIGPVMANNVTTVQVDSVDLTDTTERAGTTPPTIVNGGGVAPSPTLASCFLISHAIGSRYRGGHPRTYLPGGPNTDTPNGDSWTAGVVSQVTTAWTAFRNGVNTDLQAAGITAPTMCAPRFTYTYTADNVRHKFVKTRSTYLGPFPITSFLVKDQIATQRRRLGP